MTKNNPFMLILFIAGVLFTAGFACNLGSSTSTPDNGAPAANSAKPADTGKPAPVKRDITGAYDATGTNENGRGNYKASLEVKQHDDVYQFSWLSGGKTYDGVGVQTDNAVAVAFTEGDNGRGCGVVLYLIGPDGSLEGKTGYWGVNTIEKEKATRTSGSDLEGKYNVTGKNPKGEEYKGTLEVKKDGEGYVFRWNAGDEFEGYGIKQGDKVAVGFGGKQCSFVSYEIKSDGTLDGKWGGQGSKAFGTETAKKK